MCIYLSVKMSIVAFSFLFLAATHTILATHIHMSNI